MEHVDHVEFFATKSTKVFNAEAQRRRDAEWIFNHVEHIDHVEFLATKITKDTKVFNAEAQRCRGDFLSWGFAPDPKQH